jgi:uncharacterized protein YaaQ
MGADTSVASTGNVADQLVRTSGRESGCSVPLAPTPRDDRRAASGLAERSVSMKLVMSVVHAEDARALVQALLEQRFRATIINTTGGFLRRGNATVLSAVQDSDVAAVLQIIRRSCRSRVEELSPLPSVIDAEDLYVPPSVEVGGATVFVLNIESARRL